LENGRLVLVSELGFGIRHKVSFLLSKAKNSPCPAHGVVFNSS
jgi:hypothetical protein